MGNWFRKKGKAPQRVASYCIQAILKTQKSIFNLRLSLKDITIKTQQSGNLLIFFQSLIGSAYTAFHLHFVQFFQLNESFFKEAHVPYGIKNSLVYNLSLALPLSPPLSLFVLYNNKTTFHLQLYRHGMHLELKS